MIVTTPPNGASYALGAVVNAAYTCNDNVGGSGVATCVGPVPSGSPIDTSSLGSHSFTVTSTDISGNTGSFTRTYNRLRAGLPTATHGHLDRPVVLLARPRNGQRRG